MSKQTGPRTIEGKTKSSRNAVKHGLSSAIAVLPFEDQCEFNLLVETYVREQKPRNENEIHFVREMATARWKLDRLRKIENAVLERMLAEDTVIACPYALLAKKLDWEGDPLSKLQRSQSALERTYFRSNKELQTLRKQPLPPAVPELQNEMPEPLQSPDLQRADPRREPETQNEILAEQTPQNRDREGADTQPKIQNEIPAPVPPKPALIDGYRAFLASLPADPKEREKFLTSRAEYFDKIARSPANLKIVKPVT